MTKTSFSLVAAICAVLGLTARSATAEELSVAAFVPPQHHTNTGMFAWFADFESKGITNAREIYEALNQ